MKLLQILCVIWCLAEVCLTRRSGAGATSKDRGSLRLIWVVEMASLVCGIMIAYHFPAGRLPAPQIFYELGICLLIIGVVLRFYAIFYLGRFFTINVAIATDHRLIDSGPYRFIRHPSYAGGFLSFLGVGLCIGNWLSLLVIAVPIFAVFCRRMSIEEAALTEALGEPYRAYMKRTKRLVPLIY